MRKNKAPFLLALLLSITVAHAEYEVKPEKTTQVVLSNLDVNRVVCQDGKVSDVFYSEEKGITVTTTGSDAFVKMKMKRNLTTGQLIRPVMNVDLHIVCGGQVYSMIGALKPIPSQTIRLTDNMKGVRKNLKLLGAMPMEKRIRTILLSAYHNEYPESFSVKEINQPYANLGDNIVDKVREIRIDGLGWQLTEYLLNVAKPVRVSERDFLRPAFGKHIIAISIDTDQGEVPQGEAVRVFVLEERGHA